LALLRGAAVFFAQKYFLETFAYLCGSKKIAR
jgi:hypothetical protein